MTRLSHIVGFDDAPFPRSCRGDVKIVGAIFTGARLDGVLPGKVRRDGANATDRLIRLVAGSRFYEHLQVILLQGIALAGFNVVDIHRLNRALDRPVLVVCRKLPDIGAIRRALLENVAGGRRKWRLIERAGPMEPANGVYIQRSGLEFSAAVELLQRTAIHSVVPEPLRTAHIIARDLSTSNSHQRV